MSDNIKHPKHYTSHPSGIECIQVTEHMGFCVGNAVKYLWRHDQKGGVEDLRKAKWYIEREIERLEGENENVRPHLVQCCDSCHSEVGERKPVGPFYTGKYDDKSEAEASENGVEIDDVEPCPRCNGSGQILAPVLSNDVGYYPCPKCNGKGEA